ncbi:hypothetical protein EIP86_002175 [Pleurotus ostreatoroseus]|nr:hypothetical protein EIP86_002175 [Pleurotus ostreatoroseus]
MVNLRQASEGPVASHSYTSNVPQFSLPYLNATSIVRPVGEPLDFAISWDDLDEHNERNTDEHVNNLTGGSAEWEQIDSTIRTNPEEVESFHPSPAM